MRTIPFLCAFFSASALAAPALVTTARGDVQLNEKPAPSAPFVASEGSALTVGAGAEVVILQDGLAARHVGPKLLGIASAASPNAPPAPPPAPAPAPGGGGGGGASAKRAMSAPAAMAPPPPPPVADAASALDTLLGQEAGAWRAAAARAGGPAIERPVSGAKTLAVPEIRWRCDGCGEQVVRVDLLESGNTLWTTKGTDAVPWTGPPLPPGNYLLVVGGVESSFTVVSAADRNTAIAAVTEAELAARSLSPREQAEIAVGVLLFAGLPGEALDRAAASGDEALLAETRAKVSGGR